MFLRRGGAALLALALLAGPLAACSSDKSTSESAPQLLAHAKRTLDDTKTAHFVLDSTGAPQTGTVRPSVHIATLAAPVHHLPERRVIVIRTRAAHHGPRYAKVNSPDTSTSAP